MNFLKQGKELSAPAEKLNLEQKWKPKPSHPKQKNHQLENRFDFDRVGMVKAERMEIKNY